MPMGIYLFFFLSNFQFQGSGFAFACLVLSLQHVSKILTHTPIRFKIPTYFISLRCNCSQTESEQEILILYCRSHALCLSRSPRRRDPVHQPLGRQYFSGPPQRSQLHWQTRNRMQYSTLEEGINEASCFPAGSSPVQSRLLVPPAVRNPIRPAAINQGRL